MNDVIRIVAGPGEVEVATLERTSATQPTWVWLPWMPDAECIDTVKAILKRYSGSHE